MFMATTQSTLSGQYTVSLDHSDPVAVDGFTSNLSPVCGVGWDSYGLVDGPHTIIVNLTGQSSQASNTGQDGSSNFELDGFV